MSLLARVSEVLKAQGIPHVLAGASALTIHGVNRSTLDVDLFTVDWACLNLRIWDGLATEGVDVEVRKGDRDDPLAGVVRFEVATELAGGPQDAWDIQQLLMGPERDSLIAGVERELTDLPGYSSRLWRRILDPDSWAS